MGWRFFRRIKLFGGLGLNLSSKGISASVRTPFGSVNTRGGYSIRTPIPGLSYRGSQTSEATETHREQKLELCGDVESVATEGQNIALRFNAIKRFNDMDILYDSDGGTSNPTNRIFYTLLNELTIWLNDAHDFESQFSLLTCRSGMLRTGVTSTMREAERQMKPLIQEAERWKRTLEKLKRDTDAKG